MVEIFSIYMCSFQQERMIRVYLPKSYQEGAKRYPVLYMHDGQNVFEDEGSIKGVSLGLKDYLDEKSLEIIVVAIDLNTEGEERINEYCPWLHGETAKEILGYACPSGGKGEEYLDFIISELKPFIDRKYRTIENETSMAGISLGALISTYAACRYPHVFKKIAALSPGYYRNLEEIEKFIVQSDLSGVEKFYMDFGTKELGEDEALQFRFSTMISGVYEMLDNKIPDTKYETIEKGEHNYASFKTRIPHVISYLYSDL
ncbi:alpha/beta hydrolase [Bacillus sp. MRMR6]|uniref:alpha/beta hydrolase n=1 Tax=Bacillus sp. MRMR6 TaxID=1928617 RepID=UPI000952C91D|nr:alpha/beta hydrolase-fold protein [Bacillus sp. MRMR6]OLS40610.1 esterase [Bacillus sp. MRMR6]